MNNVYNLVHFFYDNDVEWEPVIQREWVDGFFRYKAWQGCTDVELKKMWSHISFFETYLAVSDNTYLDEIPYEGYSKAIDWLDKNVADFKKSLKYVKEFFKVLIDFYEYLLNKKIIVSMNELHKAAAYITSGKRLKMITEPTSTPGLLSLIGTHEKDRTLDIAPELPLLIGETLEQMLYNLGDYFQQPSYSADFQRALSLYTGPLNSAVKSDEEEQAEFWLGFWDYFLFDYHLLRDDKSPLSHYKKVMADKHTSDETILLGELTQTCFTVFYISDIVSGEWVECTNLFTDEKFYLPSPDIQPKDMKKLLFLGHILSETMVLVNYITNIEVSIKLRKRIKEEIIRQKDIFFVQQPNASWAEFFQRHALTVRHTIEVFTTYNKLNVTPLDQLARTFPIIEPKVIPNKQVQDLLDITMKDLGFSVHDIKLAQKLWYDYCQLSQGLVRKPETWAAGVIYTFSHLNTFRGLPAEAIAGFLDISHTSVYACRNKLHEIMQLRKYDPRYLTEEGFMFSLFRA